MLLIEESIKALASFPGRIFSIQRKGENSAWERGYYSSLLEGFIPAVPSQPGPTSSTVSTHQLYHLSQQSRFVRVVIIKIMSVIRPIRDCSSILPSNPLVNEEGRTW